VRAAAMCAALLIRVAVSGSGRPRAAARADNPPMFGFSAEEGKRETALEQRFDGALNPIDRATALLSGGK